MESSDVFIRSDTLFSALCHAWLLLFGPPALESLLQRFLSASPPFRLSSAFPVVNGDFYFPVPLNQFPREKKLKKKRLVQKKVFEKLLAGKPFEELPETAEILRETSTPYTLVTHPHIRLSRTQNRPGEDFFHTTDVHYSRGSALYFLVQFDDPGLKRSFEAALRLLCDEGIGGDRSSGKGLFHQPDFDRLTLDTPENANGCLCLSLYYPREDEMQDLTDGFYELIERRGYIYSPFHQTLRRRSVRMFTEGSVFPASSPRVGRLANVTPQSVPTRHPVYRFGILVSVPCYLGGKR